MRWRGALAPALALAATVALAACGGGDGGPNPSVDDLATAVPLNAALFVEGAVRPQGELEDSLRSSLGRLLGTPDPGAKIVSAVDRSLGRHGLTFSRDFKPWLGERGGVFFQSFGAHPDGALVAQATDPQAAEHTFREGEATGHHTVRSTTYRGTTLDLAGSGEGEDGFAILGDLVVGGSPAGVKAAIDATKGSSLADSPNYEASLEDVPSDHVFMAWADPRRVIGELVRHGALPAVAATQVRTQLGALGMQPVVVWGEASPSYLAVEASAGSSPAPATQQPSSLLGSLPADSWLAFAVHEAAPDAKRSLGASGAAGFGAAAAPVLRPLSRLGLDPAMLSAWLGDVSGFLRGQSILGLGGALVAQTRDEDASLRTIRRVEAALRRERDLVVQRAKIGGGPGFTVTPRGAPIQFVVTQKEGKVIAALGVDSVTAALKPARPLSESPAYENATAALGSGISPELYLDFQPLASLFEIPGVINDPEFNEVKPYLDRLDYLAAGTGASGDRSLVRIALGVRGGAGGSGGGKFAAAAAPKHASVGP
jgi:hypothetical protein